jgi:hypothetical protein
VSGNHNTLPNKVENINRKFTTCQHSMAKGNTATAKGKGTTRAKAPMKAAPKKAAPKKAAPKKAPAAQRNKNKGTRKRPAENESSEESSDEESDHRPCKEKRARPTGPSDDEEVEAGDKDDEEPEVMGGEQEGGHESSNDSEV